MAWEPSQHAERPGMHTGIVVQRRGWPPTNMVGLIAKLDATEALPIQCRIASSI